MAKKKSGDKLNAAVAASSAKQAAKERREAQLKKQRQQQQLLLSVGAVAVLVVVVLFIVLQNQPVEATIPDGVTSKYTPLTSKEGWYGRTPEGNYFLGSPSAPTTMEEYSSFSCVHCKDFHDNFVSRLMYKIQAGELRYVYKPILTTGSWDPTMETKGAICAGDQGKFFEFHDILFDWQGKYGTSTNDKKRLALAATSLGLDTNKFNGCLDSQDVQTYLDGAAAESTTRGVNSTPTVYLNKLKVYPEIEGQSGVSATLEQMIGVIDANTKAQAAATAAPTAAK